MFRRNPKISLKTDLGHTSSEVYGKFQLIWWSLALFLFAKRVQKMMKNDENYEKIENLKVDQESFMELPQTSGNHL